MTQFHVEWQEDGAATAVARLTARAGTGTATGVSGEGKWLKQADISTITCGVYDLDSATPGTAVATPSVVVATAIQDSPVTDGAIWPLDATGWNFYHDLADTNFPTANHRYRVIYTVTLTGGTVFWGDFEGVARKKVPS